MACMSARINKVFFNAELSAIYLDFYAVCLCLKVCAVALKVPPVCIGPSRFAIIVVLVPLDLSRKLL